MPDRYGDEPDVERIADYHSIDACDLCDDNGYIGSTVCSHYDHAAAASAMVDGAIITRYVTDWITTESPRQPVEPWHGKAATYCVRCGIPHVTPCLREENR